jgi:Subtilase family/Calx-beta domain
MAEKRVRPGRFDSGISRPSARPRQQRIASPFEALERRTLLASFVPGELLVQFAPDAVSIQQLDVRQTLGAALVETIHTATMKRAGEGQLELLRLPAGADVDVAMALAASLPGVEFAEPNWIYSPAVVSNDPQYTGGSMWGMYSNDSPTAVGPTGTTNTFGSQAEKAWNLGYTGSSGVIVGVIDEGIQIAHPDLAANIWVNPFETVDGIDNDGNGYIDDRNGWNFVNNNATVYNGTIDDHGTHVAGTIGAVGGNATGVAGVNWNIRMVSLRFLGSGGGTTANAIRAVDYLTDLKTRHGLNIVASNNSWGGGGQSTSLLNAIVRGAQANILFVAAAGNANNNNDATASYPSNYNTTAGAGYDAVIAVANITSSGAKSTSSSYGATTVDLGAPGSSIVSTVPTNAYASYSGTSMASPHVTGAVALYKSLVPGATAAQIRAALLANTTATTSLSGITVTGGRLDVYKLVTSGIPQPSISINSIAVTEGNSGTSAATFTVSLSAAYFNPVSVNYAAAAGSALPVSDFLATSGSLVFAPGQTVLSVTVPIVGDTNSEPTETFSVVLSGPSGGTIGAGTGTGTILDNDSSLSVVSIADATMLEGPDGTKRTLWFTVTLVPAPTALVYFNYSTTDGSATGGSDYFAISDQFKVQVGVSSVQLGIAVYGDSIAEDDETFFVTLSAPVNSILGDASATGTIEDDDGGLRPTGDPGGPGRSSDGRNQRLAVQAGLGHRQLMQNPFAAQVKAVRVELDAATSRPMAVPPALLTPVEVADRAIIEWSLGEQATAERPVVPVNGFETMGSPQAMEVLSGTSPV